MTRTTKKRSYKRKVSGTPKATKTIGGKRFTRKSCHTTKTAAKKAAEAIRKRGMTARVIGGCVYQGGRSKTAKKK
jgi:hypothetical protein